MDNTAQFTHLPRAITVETTATCQLRCPACPTPHTVGRSRGFFTTQLLAQLLGQIDWPLESISFGWSGEPLLNRDLSKMIALASPRGTTYVSTNGLLLERDSDALLDSGLHHLRVCLDGIDQQMAELYRVGVDFAKVVRGLRCIVERRDKRGLQYPRISFQMLITKHTEGAREQFVQLATDCGVDEVYFKSFNLSLSDWLSPTQQDQMASKYLPETPQFLRYQRTPFGQWTLRPELRATQCPEVRSSVTILHTGEVVPCCEDFGGTHIVGNIRNDSLADIWTGDKYQRLRAQVRAREPRMCRNCSFPGSVHFNQTIQLSPSRLPVAALIV